MKFFSATTLGFYTSEIHTEDMRPDDAIEISDQLYADLHDGLSKGKQLGADGNGDPVLLDPAAATPDELMEGLRYQRGALLSKSDWTQISDAPISADQKAAWATYRQALRDLPDATKDIQKISWPQPPQ